MMDLRPDLPITSALLTPERRADYLRAFRALDCRRLWIAADRDLFLEPRRDLRALAEQVAYFKENGVETGVWINAFGFGVPGAADKPWQRIVSVTGTHRPDRDEFCPADPRFTEAYAGFVAALAALNPDLIMLDDDLCLSVRPGIGCFCPAHRKMIAEKAKSDAPLTPERLFTGAPNAWRTAWYSAMGDSMRQFCLRVRRAVDAVNPAVRLGFCAGYTSWWFEGADPIALSRLLAGGTRPFFRLTAAPYWVANCKQRFPGMGLHAVMENARMQAAWCGAEDVEIFAEDDSYPRPACHVPAAYIECFDAALRAAGVRSLKYMLDYVSPLGYETAYTDAHLRHRPLFDRIEAAFAGKTPCGVRLYRRREDQIADRALPPDFRTEKDVMREYFSSAAAFFSGLGFSLCYAGDSAVSAAFGGDAQALLELEGVQTLILDLPAARLLQERGIDVGLRGTEPAPVPTVERFGDLNVLLSAVGRGAIHPAEQGFFAVTLAEGAEVLSAFSAEGRSFPAAYTYRNGATTLLVLCFDASAAGEQSTLFLSYARRAQLHKCAPALPCLTGGNGLYLCAAEAEGSQAFLIENTGADMAPALTLHFGRSVRNVRLFGAEGALNETRTAVTLTAPLYPGEMLVAETEYGGTI